MIRIHCTNILPDTSNTAESRAAMSLCEQLRSELKQYQHAEGDIYIFGVIGSLHFSCCDVESLPKER